jgi:hypothetical protein
MILQKSLKKIEKSLFHDPEGKVVLSDKEQQVKIRLKDLFVQRLEKPYRQDIELINYMKKEYGVSQGGAFYYVQASKLLFGNVQVAEKEWNRYAVENMLREAFEQAKDSKDTKNMIYAADKLGKYSRLDQDEGEKIPWHEIQPQSFEPTGDVSVLGITPIDNLREKQLRLREKYMGRIEEAKVVDDGE